MGLSYHAIFPGDSMNILYLAHRIPYPPNKGDKLRSFRHLEHLSRRHEVSCAFFVDDRSDWAHVETLRSICKEVIAIRLNKPLATARGVLGVLQGATVTESFYSSRAMDRALKRCCATRRFDAVVAFSSSMAPFALRVPARRRTLDLCDCDSQKWLAYAEAGYGPLAKLYRNEGQRLQTRERRWARAFDATLLITEAEAETLRDHAPSDRLHVVGNGVNDAWSQTESPRDQKLSASPLVGFVGVMNYRPNVDAVSWFVNECWPDIREAIPKAEFRIVGRSPSRKVRSLGRIPGVQVVGEVADVSAELSAFTLSVAPMRIACGLQNKVLEAMIAGLPVVLTTRAAQAVGGRDDEHLLVADAADRFIRSVVRLLRSAEDAARIGANARRFVLRRFRWEDQLERLEQIVVGASHPRSAAVNLASFHPAASTAVGAVASRPTV